jgi:hypothetical protein
MALLARLGHWGFSLLAFELTATHVDTASFVEPAVTWARSQ